MRRERKQILRRCYQAGAMLLVMLFLSISVAQIFHSHPKVAALEHTHQHEGNDQDQVAAADKCLICDYLAHQQSKEFYISHPLVLSVPLPDAITLNTNVFVGNYKFSLQGFTNKGPPAFSC
ncbi:hypothetical protein ACTHQF_13180 [Pedobacter sp. SAFR-022]|uniref:hypothetical protein n=1 Tax=Pedobacter sp. SAFR-022 TaxID=3436861 RepID=UPI003F7EE26C